VAIWWRKRLFVRQFDRYPLPADGWESTFRDGSRWEMFHKIGSAKVRSAYLQVASTCSIPAARIAASIFAIS
jgi:hypothetical protein